MAWSKRTDGPKRLRGRASQARRVRVLARNGGRCVRCNVRRATIADHIVNLAAGGADDELNMAGLCAVCHDAKTARESLAARPSGKRPPERHPGEVGGRCGGGAG